MWSWPWPNSGPALALNATGLGLVLEAPFAAKYYIVFSDPNTAVLHYFPSHAPQIILQVIFEDYCRRLRVAATNVSNL